MSIWAIKTILLFIHRTDISHLTSRHWLYANSCQINHCLLQHSPWGGLYLRDMLLSLHFHMYFNCVIHLVRRMCKRLSFFIADYLPAKEGVRAENMEKKLLGRIQRLLLLYIFLEVRASLPDNYMNFLNFFRRHVSRINWHKMSAKLRTFAVCINTRHIHNCKMPPWSQSIDCILLPAQTTVLNQLKPRKTFLS